MDRRVARTTVVLDAFAMTFLLLTLPALAADPDAGPSCSPNGSSCKLGSICVRGTCTFCKAAACGTACLALRGNEQIACVRSRHQGSASPRSSVSRSSRKEKAEATGLLNQLIRETDTEDCAPGVALGTNNCGQHWVQGLSDADLDGAVALVQRQIDRVTAIYTDLGLPSDPGKCVSCDANRRRRREGEVLPVHASVHDRPTGKGSSRGHVRDHRGDPRHA